MRSMRFGMALVLAALAWGAGAAARAANITVNTTSATNTDDGKCDIIEAVQAANTNQSVHTNDCPAGNGDDAIILTGGLTYSLNRTLSITSNIEIKASTSTGATISAGANWITNPQDPFSTCAIHVLGGDLVTGRLTDITLSRAAGVLSGACGTQGSMIFRRVRVTGFTAGGVIVSCVPQSGCDFNNLSNSSSLSLYSSLIDNNSSNSFGGGIQVFGDGAGLGIEQSAIVNNSSPAQGGGIFLGGGWAIPQIRNSTISGNSADTGGGIHIEFMADANTYLFMSNTTIANNFASAEGGGIYFWGAPGNAKDLHVQSSIVSNNVADFFTDRPNINADWGDGAFVCDANSLIYVVPGNPQPVQDPDRPCVFTTPDAMLAPLMGMGGTRNLPVQAPLKGSPAIDAATAGTDTQQRDSWVQAIEPPPASYLIWDPAVDGDGNGTAVRDLGAHEVNLAWQTELLVVQAKGSAALNTVTSPAGYNRGAGQNYAASSAANQFVTYQVPVAQTGPYSVVVGVRKASNTGKFQLAYADSPGGPWTNIGTEQDTYKMTATFAAISLPNVSFGSIGQKYFRFTVTNKNSQSASYQLNLDYLKLTKL